MTGNKNAVIIGAGIGGITTAAFLAKNGYRVRVYEKNPAPGGRCGQINREGHRFDVGATMFMMPGIYREVFRSLGIDPEKILSLKPLDDLYKIYFDNGNTLTFSADKIKMKEQLEKIEPGSFKRSQSYVSKGYKMFLLSMEKMIGRNFYNLFQLVNLKNIPLLFKLKVFIPHYKYARRFFKNPHLLMAFTFQNIYVGQSPFNSPALFSMVPAAELTEGSFFPAGGMYAVVEALLAEAEKSGVIFYYDSPVTRICVNGNRIEKIVLNSNEEITADIFVANADLPYVYRELLPDRRASARLDRLSYSCSAICFHWGLDKRYPQLEHHNVFLSDGFRIGLDRIFREKSVSDTPSFYVHAPARSDPSAAPLKNDTLSIAVAVGHIDKKFRQDWDAIRIKTRAAVIKRLRQQGLDDIENHIKFEICHTPRDWELACNISRGSVFGSIGHNIFQMAWFRPHNRHDRYHNLYFTGGSTHPGNGIPNVLLSAKLVSERILSGR